MRAPLNQLLKFLLGRRSLPPPSRSVVRLALRIAAYGEKVVLVDTGTNIRLEHAGVGRADLQILGTRSGGALLIARRR
jgi:hypothetical protein